MLGEAEMQQYDEAIEKAEKKILREREELTRRMHEVRDAAMRKCQPRTLSYGSAASDAAKIVQKMLEVE